MQPGNLPYRFRDLVELGAPLDVYAMPRWQLALMGTGSAVMTAAAVAFPFFARINLWEMHREWYLATVAFAMFGAPMGAFAWIRARNTIVVYEGGFAWAKGNRINSYRWNDISAMTSSVTARVVNGVPAGAEHRHTLELVSGEKLVLTDDTTRQIGRLAEQIAGKVTPRLFERHSEAYNRGEQVQFGPVTIGKSFGIQHGKKHLPWDEIESAVLNEGQLTIRKRGGGRSAAMSIPVSTVPNFGALHAIIQLELALDRASD